jgi:hypothetical protein
MPVFFLIFICKKTIKRSQDSTLLMKKTGTNIFMSIPVAIISIGLLSS